MSSIILVVLMQLNPQAVTLVETQKPLSETFAVSASLRDVAQVSKLRDAKRVRREGLSLIGVGLALPVAVIGVSVVGGFVVGVAFSVLGFALGASGAAIAIVALPYAALVALFTTPVGLAILIGASIVGAIVATAGVFVMAMAGGSEPEMDSRLKAIEQQKTSDWRVPPSKNEVAPSQPLLTFPL